MIRNWYNQIPHPALKTKREITKYINWQQFTKGTRGKPNEQLFPRQVVIEKWLQTTPENWNYKSIKWMYGETFEGQHTAQPQELWNKPQAFEIKPLSGCHFEDLWTFNPRFECVIKGVCRQMFILKEKYGPRQANLVLYRLCEQRRFRRACASAQSRQNLRCSLIQAVSREEPSDRKPDPWPLWMAGHAQLRFVMTECSKTQIRLTGLI